MQEVKELSSFRAVDVHIHKDSDVGGFKSVPGSLENEEVGAFYGPEELDRGYVEATDRRGAPVRYPLVTISVGIATTAMRMFSEFGEVVSVATEMKQTAKRAEGSCYAVDRRRAS